MGEIVMPRLTDSMEEGVILSWLKSDGDEVAVGDELVEIETDKASMVYESDLAGTLEILVPEGDTRPIGEAIANVGDAAPAKDGDAAGTNEDEPEDEGESTEDEPESRPESESAADDAKPEETGSTQADEPAPQADEKPAQAASSGGASGERIKASPLARRIAEEKGVDLSAISGSGPGGRIIKLDVEEPAAAGEQPARPDEPQRGSAVDSARGTPEIVELNRTQQLIGRRMSESKATIPHFYLRTVVNMDRALEVRNAFKAAAGEDGTVPSLNDFVVKAAAIALQRHPRANGAFRDGKFELYPKINVGIAVAAEDALIVPVIPDADRKSLTEISDDSRRLAERVRSGEVTPPELAGGTFTVSNLGMFGVTGFEAVINPGQAGILSVGEVAKRPVVTDDGIVPASQMEMTLACDHRILYGADGARFLADLKANLEEPGLLA